jgi:hypothetical protein
MARIYPCDVHETTPALLVITVQQSGDVTFACTACVPEVAAGLLMSTSGDRDPGEVLADFIARTVADALADDGPESVPASELAAADPVTGDETDDDGQVDEVDSEVVASFSAHG